MTAVNVTSFITNCQCARRSIGVSAGGAHSVLTTSFDQMFLQPFVSYQATRTITLTLQSETTANWEAGEGDDRWTVPINMAVSKLSSFGTFPASYQVGFGVFAVHPDIGPSWKVRAAIVLLLPRVQR